MKRLRRSRILTVEALEFRQLLSADSLQSELFDPSGLEQEMLEHLNRMRLAPQAELDVLFMDPQAGIPQDPDARIAVAYYQDPSPSEIAQDWAALSSAPPLAWSTSLYDAAFDHTNLMVQYNTQSHLLPGESSLAQRLATKGYQGSAVGENVFAYMNNVFHGHSAFAIDWGVPDRGHRDNMMSSTFREVGIAIVSHEVENGASDVGPFLVTQDYGDGRYLDDSYLLGVVWDDLNENGWYDAGEGFSGVQFLIEGTGGTFTATSMTAGGYQTVVSPGEYTVTAYGGDLPSPMVVHDVVIGNENVKVDFQYDPYQGAPPLVDLNGPAETGVDYLSTFYEGSPAVPIVSVDASLTDDDDEHLESLTATITNMMDPGEYLIVDTTGTPISADYDAPSGTLTLSGQATVAEYQQVLATLSYGNLAVGPDETPRVVEVEAFDGKNIGPVAQTTIYVVRTTLPELAIDDVQAQESEAGSATYQFTVTMSDTMIRTVTVDFATEDGSATAGSDYTATLQTIEFAPGQTTQTVSITVIDDEVQEPTESFTGRLSNASGATISVDSGTFTIIDDDLATRLGTVDFLGIQGIDTTAQTPIYEVTTARDGVLSVEVTGESDDEISLALYDQYGAPEAVLIAVATDGIARFDLAGVLAGQTYFVEVSGNTTDADLLLGNVVQQSGFSVEVIGTDDDDLFEFEAEEALRFVFNGLAYSYSWDEVQNFAFRGGVGDDQVQATGSTGDDMSRLYPLSGYLSDGQYRVDFDEIEAIQIAGGGGNDTVQLYDSDGDDTYISDGSFAALSGDGFANSVSNFNVILGYATAGGYDVAQFSGTQSYDEFIGKPDISKIVSDGQYVRAKFFDHVSVLGNAAEEDFARIYGDSESAEHFVGAPNYGSLAGEWFGYEVEGYYSVHGYSRGKTGDTAVLTDSPGDDVLRVSPVFVKIYGDGFLTRAKFFPDVVVDGKGEGADSGRLYDSEGDDTVVLDMGESTIEGPGFRRQIHGFDRLEAYSREGGSDTVALYDTPGDDTLIAQPGEAHLEGTGFEAAAYYFGEVLAYATAGGNDTATLYDTEGADEFSSNTDVSSITGVNYYVRVKFFDSVFAYSLHGGHDTARFYSGDNDTTFVGNPAMSTMEDIDSFRRAKAFKVVYAEAGTGTDTAIFEGSGRNDDLLETGDDWTRFSNEQLDILIEAMRFEFVTSPFEGDAENP